MFKKPSSEFEQLMQRYERATGKSRNAVYVFGRKISDAPEPTITQERLDEIKQEMRKFHMGYRLSGCPKCGFGPYEDQTILEQRIIEANDMHCAILETRRCKMCGHRYAVEVYYRPDGERFIKNDHKETTETDSQKNSTMRDWTEEDWKFNFGL